MIAILLFDWVKGHSHAPTLNDENALLTLHQYLGNRAISQGHDQNLIISNQHTHIQTSIDQYNFYRGKKKID